MSDVADPVAARRRAQGMRVYEDEQTLKHFRLFQSLARLAPLGSGVTLFFRLNLALILLSLVLFLVVGLPPLSDFLSVDLEGVDLSQRYAEGFFVRSSLVAYSIVGRSHPASTSWFAFLSLALVAVFVVGMTAKLRAYARADHASVVTAADFSVLVSNLPREEEVTAEQLREHFTRVGPVASVCISYDIRRLASLCRKHQRASEELKAFERKGGDGSGELLPRVEALASAIEKANGSTTAHRNTGFAVVTFERHSDAARLVHRSSSSLLGLLRTACLFLCHGGSRPRTWTPGALVCERAPEPGDLMWENLEFGFWARLKRGLLARLGSALVLGVSLALIVLFHEQKNDYLRDECQDWAEEEEECDSPGVRTATLLCASLVLALNYALTVTLSRLARFALPQRMSDYEGQRTFNLAFAQFINTGLLVLLVYTDEASWAVEGDLVDQIATILMANVYVPAAVSLATTTLLHPLLRRWRLRNAVSQRQLNLAYEPPDFFLSSRYAAMLKTFALGLLFQAIFPLSMLFTAFTLALTYVVDFFRLSYVCKRPVLYDETMALKGLRFLKWLLLLAATANLYFYAAGNSSGDGGFDPAAAGLSFLVVLLLDLLPLRCLLWCCGAVSERRVLAESGDYWSVDGIETYAAPTPTALVPRQRLASHAVNYCTVDAYAMGASVPRWDAAAQAVVVDVVVLSADSLHGVGEKLWQRSQQQLQAAAPAPVPVPPAVQEPKVRCGSCSLVMRLPSALGPLDGLSRDVVRCPRCRTMCQVPATLKEGRLLAPSPSAPPFPSAPFPVHKEFCAHCGIELVVPTPVPPGIACGRCGSSLR